MGRALALYAMVQVDLLRVRQSRMLPVAAEIAPDAEVWADSELRLSDAVQVDASAALTADDGVVVRGSWTAPVVYDCGRCLKELNIAVERPFALLYVSEDGWQAEDPDVRTIGRRETVLDLSEAIREEVLLEVPRYFVPEYEDGRCSECGDPVETFSYATEEAPAEHDPRWSALKALQTD